MSLLDDIRARVLYLYKTDPRIHINVTSKSREKTELNNIPAVIKGVYPHMFQIEDRSGKAHKTYMHQYADIVTKEIEIKELEGISFPEDSPKKSKARN